MRRIYLLGLLIAWILINAACGKIESYPPEPVLTYQWHMLESTTDALGNNIKRLSFSIGFVDGDGDLIVENADSSTSYSKLYLLFSQKKEGIYYPFSDPTLDTLRISLPYEDFMDRTQAQNKTFKGSIQYNYDFIVSAYDTIKVGLFVIDEALHKSNLLEIKDIPFE